MGNTDDSENDAHVFESVDDMLAAEDVEYATIPGWNGTIRVGSLTAGDMIQWSESNEGEAKREAGLRLIVKSLVNSRGQRIGNEKHIPLFRAKSHKVTESIVKAILKLNGFEPATPKKD